MYDFLYMVYVLYSIKGKVKNFPAFQDFGKGQTRVSVAKISKGLKVYQDGALQ